MGERKPSEERIWEKYYPESAKNFCFPKMKTFDLVYEENKNRKDSIALEYEGKEICYGEYFDRVEEKTDYFKSKGIKENDIVTVSMLMTPEFVYDWYALGRLNAISNLIDPRTSVQGIRQYLEEAESKYILNKFCSTIVNMRFFDLTRRIRGTLSHRERDLGSLALTRIYIIEAIRIHSD